LGCGKSVPMSSLRDHYEKCSEQRFVARQCAKRDFLLGHRRTLHMGNNLSYFTLQRYWPVLMKEE